MELYGNNARLGAETVKVSENRTALKIADVVPEPDVDLSLPEVEVESREEAAERWEPGVGHEQAFERDGGSAEDEGADEPAGEAWGWDGGPRGGFGAPAFDGPGAPWPDEPPAPAPSRVYGLRKDAPARARLAREAEKARALEARGRAEEELGRRIEAAVLARGFTGAFPLGVGGLIPVENRRQMGDVKTIYVFQAKDGEVPQAVHDAVALVNGVLAEAGRLSHHVLAPIKGIALTLTERGYGFTHVEVLKNDVGGTVSHAPVHLCIETSAEPMLGGSHSATVEYGLDGRPRRIVVTDYLEDWYSFKATAVADGDGGQMRVMKVEESMAQPGPDGKMERRSHLVYDRTWKPQLDTREQRERRKARDLEREEKRREERAKRRKEERAAADAAVAADEGRLPAAGAGGGVGEPLKRSSSGYLRSTPQHTEWRADQPDDRGRDDRRRDDRGYGGRDSRGYGDRGGYGRGRDDDRGRGGYGPRRPDDRGGRPGGSGGPRPGVGPAGAPKVYGRPKDYGPGSR